MSPRLTILFPIRRTALAPEEIEELRAHFEELSRSGADVLVIDGSPAADFARHHAAWSGVARHRPVDPRHPYRNGKVNGIHTGVALARANAIVVADDDVRYRPDELERMRRALERYDLVRPQNYLHPLPWWARLEASRMLLNRAFLAAGDYSGTVGFRRDAFERVGPYDGDVLFDNEEIVRHFAAAGARVGYALAFFVRRRPTSLAKWLEQRPRQAYEDFSMRAKTGFFAALLPALGLTGALAGARGAALAAGALALGAIAAAALGRRGAEPFVPASIPLFAPLWVVERSLSTWVALFRRGTRRGLPFGGALLTRGTGRDWVAGRPPAGAGTTAI